jgi:hypothetical protein
MPLKVLVAPSSAIAVSIVVPGSTAVGSVVVAVASCTGATGSATAPKASPSIRAAAKVNDETM